MERGRSQCTDIVTSLLCVDVFFLHKLYRVVCTSFSTFIIVLENRKISTPFIKDRTREKVHGIEIE